MPQVVAGQQRHRSSAVELSLGTTVDTTPGLARLKAILCRSPRRSSGYGRWGDVAGISAAEREGAPYNGRGRGGRSGGRGSQRRGGLNKPSSWLHRIFTGGRRNLD